VNAPDLLVAAFMAAGAVLRGWQARRAWHDAEWWQRPPGRLWQVLLGRTIARGADRALVPQAIILVSAAMLMAGLAIATVLSGAAARHATSVSNAVGGCGLLLGTGLAISIIVLNRPGWLVPVPCRVERGLLPPRRGHGI
jgi:hypothetical protein